MKKISGLSVQLSIWTVKKA